MVPKFNANGYLPKGVHKATLSEIKQRFGSSASKRKELFKGFQTLVKLLRKHEKYIERFLLNGSFVTDKNSPKDFDCILIVKNDFDFSSPEAKQLLAAKWLFNAHIFTFTEEDVSRISKLTDFFGRDRDRKAKGLVEVML